MRCFSGRSDILYIPRKHAKAFSILAGTFYEQKVFLEIAIPTIIRFLERSESIGRLPGYYIPGDVRKNDFRVTDSRYFWFVYFPKNKIWFIHPFKLHGQEMDKKFNLVMLKFILIEKVRSQTSCAPSVRQTKNVIWQQSFKVLAAVGGGVGGRSIASEVFSLFLCKP